jgi:DNA-directed RNA polymerase specialized sigma24 family protein
LLDLHVLKRHHRELLNFLSCQVSDRDIAADSAQECFVRVLHMRALLYRTARNLVIDQHPVATVPRPFETNSPCPST